MLHRYAALRSIASGDIHVLQQHGRAAVGGKEFLRSQAAAGTGGAARPPRRVKTCSFCRDSEVWSQLVIFLPVLTFVQPLFCPTSTCLYRTYYKGFALGVHSNSWKMAVGWDLPQHKWFKEDVAKKPEVLHFPLIW